MARGISEIELTANDANHAKCQPHRQKKNEKGSDVQMHTAEPGVDGVLSVAFGAVEIYSVNLTN